MAGGGSGRGGGRAFLLLAIGMGAAGIAVGGMTAWNALAGAGIVPGGAVLP